MKKSMFWLLLGASLLTSAFAHGKGDIEEIDVENRPDPLADGELKDFAETLFHGFTSLR